MNMYAVNYFSYYCVLRCDLVDAASAASVNAQVVPVHFLLVGQAANILHILHNSIRFIFYRTII